jgi:hypothetical protein
MIRARAPLRAARDFGNSMQHARIFAWGTLALAAVACGGSNAESAGPAIAESKHVGTSVEVAELEISATGLDRFVSCPPAGELGQGWIPTIPPWTAPPLPKEGRVESDAPLPAPPDDGRTETERAIADTYRSFRSCYRQGLVRAPRQEGHAAIVLRVGGDGRVASVEHYGACDLSTEVIACLRGVAGKLRFRPPASGSDTITIPAAFTPSHSRMEHEHPSENAAYTAAAYITIENARPDFHSCEGNARRAGKPVEASASFALSVAQDGRVLGVHVDNFLGDTDLLTCAAHVFERLQFSPPPGGRGQILARLVFNPRAGSR